MKKAVILIFLGVLTGVTGCMLQRAYPPTDASNRSNPYEIPDFRSKERTLGKPQATQPENSSEGLPDEDDVKGEKQRSIPSLESRLAKAGTGGAHIIHRVKAGETLSEIAKTHYGVYRKDVLDNLKTINEIQETDTVQAGWKLILPIMTIDGDDRPKLPVEDASPSDPVPKSLAEALKPSESIADNAPGAAPPPPHAEKTTERPPSDRCREGVAAFERGDYPSAYEAFAALSGDGQACKTCGRYLEEIEVRADRHFEKGLDFFRQRAYARAAQEFEKACIPPMRSQAAEYLFKSHFEIALKQFLEYQRTRDLQIYTQAKNSLNQARRFRPECLGCADYEEAFKKTHYNNGIKYFTGNDGDSMDNALREWERVQFVDPGYKDVSENILQAEALLKKLKKFKKVSL